MARIWKRRYELLVGNTGEFLRITNENDGPSLRITFSVAHGYGDSPTYAEISVYGLKPGNEAKIFDKYRMVTLQAGYRELYGRIFHGQIVNIQRERSGPGGVERCIKLFCRSGAQALDESFVNITLGPNTPYTEIIRACAAKFGKPVIFLGDFSHLPKCLRGYILNGSTKAALNKLAKSFRFDWYITEEHVMIAKEGAVQGGETFKISARSGMIGSPAVTDISVNTRMVLNAAIQVGRVIRIESEAPRFEFSGAYWNEVPRSIGEGVYRVVRYTHIGDSHGDQWETQIECNRYLKDDQERKDAELRLQGIY